MQDYRFSLTAASLMLPEFVNLAKALRDNDFKFEGITSHDLGKERTATGKRELAELKLRLKTLSSKEITFLTETRIENQKLITFLANARVYRILREFIEEVMWEKISVFDEQLNASDLANFIYNKSIEYPEIENLSPITIKKIQQVIFKILEQASLIDSVKSKKIQIPFLDFELQNLLSKTDQKHLLSL